MTEPHNDPSTTASAYDRHLIDLIHRALDSFAGSSEDQAQAWQELAEYALTTPAASDEDVRAVYEEYGITWTPQDDRESHAEEALITGDIAARIVHTWDRLPYTPALDAEQWGYDAITVEPGSITIRDGQRGWKISGFPEPQDVVSFMLLGDHRPGIPSEPNDYETITGHKLTWTRL